MLAVYIGALVVAVGVLGLQLVLGHHGADGHDTGGDHDVDHDATFLTFFGSVRFWTFTLLAFGLVGSLLSWFGFAGAALTAVLATVFGIGSGVLAVTVIRRLTNRGASSHATNADVLGHIGRVIVPPNERGACKIRVEVKGSTVDYVARATEPIGEGDTVLVDEIEGDLLLVSRAPKELKP